MNWIVRMLAVVTYCLDPGCGHKRTLHSREGCTNCGCRVKYMDKDWFA